MDNINIVNNFWGTPSQTGYKTIISRMKDSLQTIQEILNYYEDRINIEKEYTKRLDKLNQKYVLGSRETGSLKIAIDKLSMENQTMVQHNYKFIKSVDVINQENLKNFYKIYERKVQKIEHHMNKLISKLESAYKSLQNSKRIYQENCSSIKSMKLTVQTTWGKELEKNETNLRKLQSSARKVEEDYTMNLQAYNELVDIYNCDWSMALQDFYKLEIERIQLCKVNCFNFCNNIATLCVDNDQAVDVARSTLAKIQPQKDLQDFSKMYGTGNKILKSYTFIDYRNGFDDSAVREETFDIANFEDPEIESILSRTYSTYSQASQAVNNRAPQPKPQQSSPHPQLPSSINIAYSSNSLNYKDKPIPQLPPATPSPTKVNISSLPLQQAPATKNKLHQASSIYSSSPEDDKNDVFSINKEKGSVNSNGYTNSNYSNPTNYSVGNGHAHTSSTYSNEGRTWSSPRRKSKQLNDFQEQINQMSRERSTASSNNRKDENEVVKPTKVPIMKDFSIDFIAKALEDLSSGGNGDVNQYRRSVRLAREHEDKYKQYQSETEPTTPYKTRAQSDYVDDRTEIATRYDSINFNSPSNYRKERPKSMIDEVSNNKPHQHFHRRSLSKLPTTSYNDLNSIISPQKPNIIKQITPITKSPYIIKARAKYSYKPQQDGELFFKKNWHMYILHKQADNWFVCELADNCQDHIGKVGLVPGNYLEENNSIF
ncbi:uncharacterized protein RJT21DRAFT_84851 [Scheffersomyces amazonensis]|uniref:uncharacterized protein n=1 Tax=Scheffersomyces amazonensis TaxID=1078765 RepID=UPI00315C4DA4